MRIGKHQMDMTQGPLLRQMVAYSVPLVFSTILQFSFNIADMMIVGRFGSYEALAGVGASHYIVIFMLSLFSGASVGSTVVVGRFFGARNRKMVSRAVHTAAAFGGLSGLGAAVFGLCFSKLLLRLLGTPEEIIDGAATYLRIYMAGSIFIIMYNVGSSILRASGDSKRPLLFITVAGVINVILNLFFVVVCEWYEGGVAMATILSKAVAAAMVLRILVKSRDACRLKFRNLHIDFKCLKDILWIGLPTGFQSGFFHLSNMVVQSAINSFGTFAVAGSIAASNVGVFMHAVSSPMCMAAVAFISQNIGAKRYDRMYKSIFYAAAIAIGSGALLGWCGLLFREELISMYNSTPEVVDFGVQRCNITFSTYFLGAFTEISSSCLRGIGYSVLASVNTLIGACGLRIVWIWAFFPLFPDSFGWMLTAYPVSWLITGAANSIILWYLCKKMFPMPRKKQSGADRRR